MRLAEQTIAVAAKSRDRCGLCSLDRINENLVDEIEQYNQVKGKLLEPLGRSGLG